MIETDRKREGRETKRWTGKCEERRRKRTYIGNTTPSRRFSGYTLGGAAQ